MIYFVGNWSRFREPPQPRTGGPFPVAHAPEFVITR